MTIFPGYHEVVPPGYEQWFINDPSKNFGGIFEVTRDKNLGMVKHGSVILGRLRESNLLAKTPKADLDLVSYHNFLESNPQVLYYARFSDLRRLPRSVWASLESSFSRTRDDARATMAAVAAELRVAQRKLEQTSDATERNALESKINELETKHIGCSECQAVAQEYVQLVGMARALTQHPSYRWIGRRTPGWVFTHIPAFVGGFMMLIMVATLPMQIDGMRQWVDQYRHPQGDPSQATS